MRYILLGLLFALFELAGIAGVLNAEQRLMPTTFNISPIVAHTLNASGLQQRLRADAKVRANGTERRPDLARSDRG